MGRTLKNLGRLREITAVVARHGLGHYLAQRRGRRTTLEQETLAQELPTSARRFRNVLEELGTTFIKFGQVLSTRTDLLPPGFAEALTDLQDQCAPMPWEDVRNMVQQGLGAPIEALFAEFDSSPVASASIAQVHRAVTQQGHAVAVKIQRPNIRQKIESDIDLLTLLAQLADTIIHESGFVTPRAIIEEFENALLAELNFRQEAQMLQRFKQNAEGKARTYVVPNVYPELSCDTVLTMEFMHGRRIHEIRSSTDRADVVNNITQAAFDQLFMDGLFHADPHPGNCLILPDNRLALIDFGSVGQISYAMRETLVVLVLSITMNDADAVARLLYRVGMPEHRISLHQLRDACASLFADRLGDRRKIAHADTAELLGELFDMAARFRIRIPSEYALVARASMTVEGIVRQLDPELEILDRAKPMMRQLIEEQFKIPNISAETIRNLMRARDIVRELPITLSQILMDLENGKLRIEVENHQLAVIARNIDTLGLSIFTGLIASGLITGSFFILAKYDVMLWGLPIVPTLGLYAASMLFGAVLGRHFLAPRLRKISLARWLRARRR